jgi:hypothetical protein
MTTTMNAPIIMKVTKRALFALAFAAVLASAPAMTSGLPAKPAPLAFSAPSYASPYFEIHAPFAIETAKVLFKSVTLNGTATDQFLLLKDGKPVDLARTLAPGDYDLVLNFAWRPAAPYKASAILQQMNGRDDTLEWAGTSPEQGGIPAVCEEGFYRVFNIEETANLERKGEIVTLTITKPKADVEMQNYRIYDGPAAVPYQIVETRESVPPASQAKTHPVTVTTKLALPLDAGPGQRKILIVLKGEGGRPAEGAFAVNGEGLGKTVSTSRIALGFHPQSGQINTIEYFKERIKLHNDKAGVIHWNPDVFVPGIAWDHSFDWNPPASFAEKNGPFLYLNARKGPMPRVKDVALEVKYTVAKDAPYFIVETLMTVGRDMGVVALRNDEMVLYKRLFDTLIYKDRKDGVVQRPLIELPGFPYGLAHIAPAELDWVGLVNTFNRYGFFGIRLQEAAASLGAAGDFSHKAGTYFYVPADGEYVYWVRPYLYTWGEFLTSNHLTFLPQGSVFYEKNAYILLPMSEKTPAILDELALRLKSPLRVF